jgi:hypothetical protein
VKKVNPDEATQAFADLSAALWRVRELLDLLTYKIEVERALVETGRAPWVPRATQEIERLMNQVREADLLRAIETAPVAEALRLDGRAPLGEIVAAAPEPWDHVLADHQQALLAATRELTEAAEANRQLLAAGYRSVQDTLAQFTGSAAAATYTATGAAVPASERRLFDQSS